jgi:hypothetical protein
MCGFCRITNLGILLFNFSNKNCSSKVYTYLEKVVVLVTLRTTKLSLIFLDFFTILYWIYKLQPKHSKGIRILLHAGPWEDWKAHRSALSLHKTPWKFLWLCNVVPGTKGRRGWPKSGNLAGGLGRGRVWEGSRSRVRPIRVLVWGRRTTGEQAQRRPATVAVGAVAPVKIGAGQGNSQRCELQDVLGEELGALIGSGCKRKEGLIVAASKAAMWRPRFLINAINTNDRISRVKPTEHRSNLGQPGSSPRKPRQWTILDPLTKSTHTRGQPLVKDTVKPRLRIDVSECRPELLPRSPKFT